MSAWMVETGHVDILVAAGIGFGLVAESDAQAHGRMLLDANAANLDSRYGDVRGTLYSPETIDEYVFQPATRPLDPMRVFKALLCYQYVTNVRPGPAGDDTDRFCGALRAALSEAHSDLPSWDTSPEYQPIPWGFTSVEQAYATGD